MSLIIGTPSDLYSKESPGIRRIKVQTLTLSEQYVVDGIAYTTNWFESDLPANNSFYAEFVVPEGFYLALDYRLVNTSKEYVVYKVYPQGTYTVGTDKSDTADNFARNRNLRQGGVVLSPLRRVNVITTPADDDFIVFVPVFGATASGNRASGSLSPDDTFLLLSPNQSFLLEVENRSSSAANVQVLLNYGLIPESIVPPIPA